MNNPDTIESLRAERNQYKTALERIVLLSHNPNEDRSLRMIEMRKTAQNALSHTSEEGKEERLDGNFMPKIDGKAFRCHCGCNVFGKLKYGNVYICNACDERYEGE